MALSSLVDALATQISTALDDPPGVGSAPVTAIGDLARVTVSIESATAAMRSVGQVPGPIQTGALRVDVWRSTSPTRFSV